MNLRYAMRRSLCWLVSVFLLLGGMAGAAQVPNSDQNGQPPGSSPEAKTTSTAASSTPVTAPTLTPGVTITGKEPPLPKLLPDEFTNCTRHRMGLYNPSPDAGTFDSQMAQMSTTTWMCEAQLTREMQVVIDACLNRTGTTTLPRIIQACTESLDRKLLESDKRFYLVASRADAYFVYGDRRHALNDYSAAIKLAPRNAELYYDRGVVFASQSNDAAALRDFNTALEFDSKFGPALRQRAKIYVTRGNLAGALADYSEAIRLQPKAAALWRDRGQVDLGQHDYRNAIKDEAHAIQIDPKLASAYYLRSVAFGASGDRAEAVSDLHTAVGLDPSLATYVAITGKTVVLRLPPL